MPIIVPINPLKNLKLFSYFLLNALFPITRCLNDRQSRICESSFVVAHSPAC